MKQLALIGSGGLLTSRYMMAEKKRGGCSRAQQMFTESALATLEECCPDAKKLHPDAEPFEKHCPVTWDNGYWYLEDLTLALGTRTGGSPSFLSSFH